jgi:hypothetical protein
MNQPVVHALEKTGHVVKSRPYPILLSHRLYPLLVDIQATNAEGHIRVVEAKYGTAVTYSPRLKAEASAVNSDA